MMASTFGRLAALSRSSLAPKSHLGSLSLFSTASALHAPAAASKKPSLPTNHYGRSPILPTSILPPSPQQPSPVENLVWRTALLQDLQKKQKEDINNLQDTLDSLRIARIPTNGTAPTTEGAVPTQPQQHRTFQVMNRNARKPKRANHGKRPCSRIRRRFKFKKFANTSRKG